MARVTVEDCVDKVPNRFRLVMLAAQRARELSVGGQITVDRDNDKNPVVALREIADETVPVSELEEELIQGLQRHADTDDPEEEGADQLAMEEELTASAEADAFTGEPGLEPAVPASTAPAPTEPETAAPEPASEEEEKTGE